MSIWMSVFGVENLIKNKKKWKINKRNKYAPSLFSLERIFLLNFWKFILMRKLKKKLKYSHRKTTTTIYINRRFILLIRT